MPQFKCTKCRQFFLIKEFSHRGLCQNCEQKRADGVEKEVREDLRVQSDRILQCEDVIVRLGPDLEAQARITEKTQSKMKIELAVIKSEVENLKLQQKEKDKEIEKIKAEVEKERAETAKLTKVKEIEKIKAEVEKERAETAKLTKVKEIEKIKAEEKKRITADLEKDKNKTEVEKERIKADKELQMLQMKINAGINTEQTPANSNTKRTRPQATTAY
jgi:cancer susceptibility candidate protein 1